MDYLDLDYARMDVIKHYHNAPYIIEDVVNKNREEIRYLAYVDYSNLYASTKKGVDIITNKDDIFLDLVGMMVNTDKSNYTTINTELDMPIKMYDRIKDKEIRIFPNDNKKRDKTLGLILNKDLKWTDAREELEMYIDKTLTILNRQIGRAHV